MRSDNCLSDSELIARMVFVYVIKTGYHATIYVAEILVELGIKVALR